MDSTNNPITLNADVLNVTGADKNAVVGEKSSDVTVTVAGENYFPLQDDKEGSNFVIGHAEAKVGDKYYSSIEKAITLSSAGATVEVLSDAEIEGPIEINHNLTLNGNGKSITAKYEGGTGNKSILTALAGTGVTIENIALNDSPKYGVQAYNQSKVSLNGVTINNASYGGVLANGGDCDITNVVVNGDSPAIELAYGDNVTKVSNVTINGLTGNNNGIYVDQSQFESKVGVVETNQLIERLTTVATKNGFNLYTDSGVVVVNDDAVENKVNNPAETLAVNKEWNAFNDTKEAAKAGDAKLGYNTLILKESTNGGYVSYQYNGHPLNENGTAVSFKLYLDPAAYNNGESFTPSIALNGQDGKYCVEYGIMIQRDGDGFNFNGNHYAVEKDDVYTVTVSFAKKGDLLVVKGTVTNESGQVVYEEYLTDNSHPDAMGNATSVRYVWIHSNEQVDDVYVNNPEVILCTDKVQTPTEEESKSETTNVVTTWDDGGPFTTDANGNVFDRWGNEIWHNPVQSVSGTTGGFQLVNTSDR